MPVYNYTAKNSLGKIIKGSELAADQNAAYAMLKERRLIPIKIAEQTVYNGDILEKLGLFKSINPKRLSIFSRQFAAVLRAGVPILKALEILQNQTEDKNFKITLEKIYQDVKSGVMLSDAMRNREGVFPDMYLSMIEAGEVSGTLDNSLDTMANHFEKEFKLRKKIRGALSYPSFVVLICIAAVCVLLTVVVPIFSSVYASMGAKLPATTTILINLGKFMKSFWYILLLFVGLIIYGVIYIKRTPALKRKADEYILQAPLISLLIKKTNSAILARILATMLSSGISILKSLEVAEKVTGNIIMKEKVRQIKEEVTRGGGLSGPVADTGVYPIMLSQMIAIGEESGALDKMLEKTAEFYEEEVDNTISQLMTMLEPAILVVMAVIVGFIVISVMLPMFNMSSAIK
jgi:type IV pilus assembly protein PilC